MLCSIYWQFSSRKIEKCVIITHANVVSNLYDFLSSVKHKITYFEKCLSVFFSNNGSQMVTKMVTKILNIIQYIVH